MPRFTVVLSVLLVVLLGFTFAQAGDFDITVYKAQRALKALGHDPGPTDRRNLGCVNKGGSREVPTRQRHPGNS